MPEQRTKKASGTNGTTSGASSVAKVSHTLEVDLAERLREFAFRQRVSESAVIEYALTRFFKSAGDTTLGNTLRDQGAGKRRKSS